MKYSKFILPGALLLFAGIVGAAVLHPTWSKVKADSSQVRESYTAMLSASQEIMASSTASSTSPASSGVGNSFFNLMDDGKMVYRIEVSNLTSPITAAHLHCAAPGQNGQIIVPLVASTTSGSGVGSTGGKAILSGTISESDITAAAMSCNPNIKTMAHLTQAMKEGMIYVNVHTEMYPMGEVRGQLALSNQTISLDNTATSTIATTTTSTTATSTNTTSTSTDTTNTGNTGGTSTTTSTTTVTTSPNGWYYVFVKPDSYYKNQGSSITFTGSHFVPGETVTVSLPHTTVATVTADSSGNFTTGAIMIPYNVGQREFTFMGNQSQIAFPVQITVGNSAPWIGLSTYYAPVGTSVTVSGHQFGGNENVDVMWNGTSVGSTRANSSGDFSFTTIVPANAPSQTTITARGTETNMTASQPFSRQ